MSLDPLLPATPVSIPPDRIADVWGPRTPHGASEPWPVRVDQCFDPDVDPAAIEWRQSACVLCSNGCGVDVAVAHGRMVGIRGRADDHVNRGRLGPKGSYGWQANHSVDRLTTPLVRREGVLTPVGWDVAMDEVVRRSTDVLAEHGPLAMGFYDTGQLFIEDYYTLALMVRAGIGTQHLDGNTRMCTATSDAALKESFGTDGAPGSLDDISRCDTLFHVGHNPASTHTVLWARVLDRLAGPDPLRLVVVDPRETPTARTADVHLAPLPGTNLALLNGLIRLLIRRGAVDHEFVAAHTVGFEQLEKVTAGYTPGMVAEVCGVTTRDLEAAAELLGTAERLVSTCLQGVYQSHQATASAVQVNNIHLLRGMIGRPGCTVFQMNGQPTAQNTRECGANGDLMGNRNWQNMAHVAELAQLWKVDPLDIPTWAPPTHAMQIFRHAEEGSIRFLWVIGTNPAVSLPELHRIRSILGQERLFLVVSDAFLTETAELADVVLPAAMWGEKTGTFTNHDRTVHLSEQAVAPPGDAKPDMEVFLDYAARMGLRNREGEPLIPWSAPEGAFDAFKAATVGRPCDYSGLTYAKLRDRSGIQWPCNDAHPDGSERLYTDHVFNTETAYCEDWGHDLATGAAHERKDHAALEADGRAIIKAAHFVPPHEPVDDEFPFIFTTGRSVYQFHTRTKTGRVPVLDRAAPEAWLEISPADAAMLGIIEDDLVVVTSRRGELQLRAKLAPVRDGVVFAPFHYGYWDERHDGGDKSTHSRAANELTITDWDPVSKQPTFKVSAVRIRRWEATS